MIHNQSFIDLENYIDLTEFDRLHPEICRGIATAKHLAIDGLHEIPEGTIRPHAQGLKVKPVWDAYKLWNSLPDTDPLKIAGKDLNYNQLTEYLKFAFGGYDLYSIYRILQEGWHPQGMGEFYIHFSKLIDWVITFKTSGIFESLSSSNLLVLEAGGIPWEHADLEYVEADKPDLIHEFIHIKTDIDRPFYIINSETQDKTYMNTRVAYWNERNWHGGEPINRPTYTLRINGRFTEEFRTKIGIKV
jgi:hypothetical protein